MLSYCTKQKLIIVVGLSCILSLIWGRAHANVRLKQVDSRVINSTDINSDSKVCDKSGFYSNSYALVIGNSEFDDARWEKLETIPEELRNLSNVLSKKHCFKVTKTVIDADRSTILASMEEFVREYGTEKNARLVIAVASHSFLDEHNQGYLVTKDTPHPSIDSSYAKQNAILYSELELMMRKIQSNHALLLLDSCFSGTLTSGGRSEGISAPAHLFKQPSRYVITAGNGSEKVPNKSKFMPAIIKVLSGKSGFERDGVLYASSIANYVYTELLASNYHSQNGNIAPFHQGEMMFFFDKVLKENMQPDGYVSFSPSLYPEEATIEFTNRGLKYNPGMFLKPGQYELLISAPGWVSQKQAFRLTANNDKLSIRLQPKVLQKNGNLPVAASLNLQDIIGSSVVSAVNALLIEKSLLVLDTGTQTRGSIIKAETIHFKPGAALYFTDYSADQWVIFAKKLILQPGVDGISIGRNKHFTWATLPQSQRGKDADPASGYVANGQDGARGKRPTQASAGVVGATVDLPPLYIIAEEVNWLDEFGNTVSSSGLSEKLELFMAGIPGQDSSISGNGANASNGVQGKSPVEKTRNIWKGRNVCEKLAGKGGDGGWGGLPGQAASGSRGGNSSNIHVVGSESLLASISNAIVIASGGYAGKPGTIGKVGLAGKGASGGEGSTLCPHDGDRGIDGQKPVINFPAMGLTAKNGKPGELKMFLTPRQFSFAKNFN